MLAYLIRHWRGELPLGVAWWLNGVGLTALSLALEMNLGALGLGQGPDTRAGVALFVAAGVLLLLLVPAWQVIGIFRAADRHAAEVGTPLAAYVTQGLATVLTILLALRFVIFAGESYSGLRLAFPISGWHYQVSVHGRLLEVSGSITFGLADEVRAAIAANPQLRRVRLNSGGGSLSEAQKLRAIIIEHDLDTDSSEGCSSACVSAYIGGHQRLLHSSARIGLHLPRNPGFGLRGPLTPAYAAELRYFASRGVPPWFLQRWITSGREFWYPTPLQLWQAGIVQAFFGPPRPGEALLFL